MSERSPTSLLALATALCLGALLGALATTGVARANGPDPPHCLPALMAERLSVMPAVAQYKWNRDLPVEDLAREAEILARFGARGDVQTLDSAFVARFFQAQMDAAKDMQRRRMVLWAEQRRPPFTDVPDLKTEVRLALDRLTKALIACLSASVGLLTDPDTIAQLRAVPEALRADEPAWRIAIAPLVASSVAP